MQQYFSYFKQKARAPDDEPESTVTSAVSMAFPSGIKLLHCPLNSTVDIVFVHGLTGNREGTWTAHNALQPWPGSLLPFKLPTARILTFGYDAGVVGWTGMVSQSRIANHAGNLLAALATYREEDNTNERPIIFVCHSLGGLVCEDALVTAKDRPAHIRNILHSTRGIIFLGTPHHGAGLARWAELLARHLGIVKQMNDKILDVLKRDSEVLARIQDSFHTMIRAHNEEGRPPIEMTCFYEEIPVLGVGLIVPQHSAILPGYIPIGIHANHMDMTKFAAADDPGFIAVTGELRRWIKSLTAGAASGSADPATARASKQTDRLIATQNASNFSGNYTMSGGNLALGNVMNL
ncbi:Alpha/Beta hydrolase protein [Nemania sp. FL0916]|nr:Alpha/Beta hydrolase protein [Nemania sp. FL0916]